jgi:hypothetical protein
MVESHDEQLMEIAREMGLDCLGRMKMTKKKKTVDEMPPHHHFLCALMPRLRRSTKKTMWR